MAPIRRNRAARLQAILFLAAGGMLSAQTFHAALDLPVGNSPAGVTTGDFNRDGKLDLAVSNSGSSSISILLGMGNGSLGSRRDVALGSRHRNPMKMPPTPGE